jgi:hypothetical protein
MCLLPESNTQGVGDLAPGVLLSAEEARRVQVRIMRAAHRMCQPERSGMNQKTTQVTRPSDAAFVVQTSSTTMRSSIQFDETRRNRISIRNPKEGFVISLKDSAPGVILIGVALAEAIFVEPIRSIRHKFRGS